MVLAVPIVVAVSLLAMCGPSVPGAADYIGKWEGTVESLTGSEGKCHLEISAVGKSFVIKSVRQRIGNCAAYEGVWTLTLEGNLKGGPLGNLLIAYDKTTARAVVSGLGQLRFLRRPTEEELQGAFFEGTWQIPSRRGDLLEIEDVGGGQYQFRGGVAQPGGRIDWQDRWPAQIKAGALHVNFGKASAKLTKIAENELSYEESGTAVKAERVP